MTIRDILNAIADKMSSDIAEPSPTIRGALMRILHSNLATGPQGPRGLQGPSGGQGAQGPSGPQGAQGNQGVQGEQGVPGLDGQDGQQGEQGQQGPAGMGIVFKGDLPDIEELNLVEDPNSGDVYFITETGMWMVWDTSSWRILAPQGPQGPAGVNGEPGERGLQGLQGIEGPRGLQGLEGPTGPTGAQGATGATGGSFTYRGNFSQGTTYNVGDIVRSGRNLYVRINSAGQTGPPSSNWLLFLSDGQDGAPGEPGQNGAMIATSAMLFIEISYNQVSVPIDTFTELSSYDFIIIVPKMNGAIVSLQSQQRMSASRMLIGTDRGVFGGNGQPANFSLNNEVVNNLGQSNGLKEIFIWGDGMMYNDQMILVAGRWMSNQSSYPAGSGLLTIQQSGVTFRRV